MNPVYVTHLTLIVVMTIAAGSRLAALHRRPHDMAVRALFLMLLCCDIALTLGYPAGYRFAYRLLGEVPGLPQLFQRMATIGMAYCVQVFTLGIVSRDASTAGLRRSLWRRRRSLFVSLVAVVACYLLGPLRSGRAMISATGESYPNVAAYVTVIYLYSCIAVTDILRLCWVNRNIENRLVGVGLRLTGIGCAFGVLFFLHKISYFLAVAMSIRLPWAESGCSGVQLAFLGPALLFGATGILVPGWGPRIASWRKRRTVYRCLRPLASAVPRAAPHSGIRPSMLRGQHARLLFRVIAIRDALIGPLRSHLDRRAYELAYARAAQTGATDEEAKVIAEATCIAVAVESARAGVEPADTPPPLSLHRDLESEAAWLSRVSLAYAGSTLVSSLSAELAARALSAEQKDS